MDSGLGELMCVVNQSLLTCSANTLTERSPVGLKVAFFSVPDLTEGALSIPCPPTSPWQGLQALDNQQLEQLEEDIETLQDTVEKMEEEHTQMEREKVAISQEKASIS